MKHLYTNNLAGPKFYFTFAGLKIFLLFSLLYEKYWVIQMSKSLVRFWETYLKVLSEMSRLHDSVISRTMFQSFIRVSLLVRWLGVSIYLRVADLFFSKPLVSFSLIVFISSYQPVLNGKTHITIAMFFSPDPKPNI